MLLHHDTTAGPRMKPAPTRQTSNRCLPAGSRRRWFFGLRRCLAASFPRSRPAFLLAVALCFDPASLRGKESPTPAETARAGIFAQDVEFLLEELPKRAGHFFELKKIDWEPVRKEFREAVKEVTTEEEHLKLCQRLLARLKDGHAALRDLKVKWPDESRGRRWTGPRVHLLVIGEKVYVRTAFGPAAARGIKTGQEVLSIDGVPARRWLERKAASMQDESCFSTDHQTLYAACHWGLADWEGTPIAFELRDPEAGEVKTITIVRQGGPNFAPLGPLAPPQGLKREGRQLYGKTAGGFGYIHLRDVPGNLPEQLDVMLEAIGEAPGLILDLRANGGGGCDHAAVMGRFLPPGESWGRATGQGARPFTGPMVVIYDAGARSAGETIGGMFKEDGGRAYTIGDTPTAGTSSQKTTLPLPSGLFSAYFSIHSNMGRYNQGRGIEGIGMAPAEITPYDPADLVAGIDTQIRLAEERLRQGLPEEAVGYVPPGHRKPER